MERLSKLLKRLFLIIGSIILVGGVLLLGLTLWGSVSQIEELEAAKANWAARPFTRYHVVIEQSGFGTCRQDFEMENEVITIVFENGCGSRSPHTITDLFNDIESTLTSHECGPNGCECDGVKSVTVVYHEQLGYPMSIDYHFKKKWLTVERLLSFGQVGCTLVGYSFVDYSVAVTPLP
jgi:hypothetical protein